MSQIKKRFGALADRVFAATCQCTLIRMCACVDGNEGMWHPEQ